MSEPWDLYFSKFGKAPETPQHLLNFSKQISKPLSFKECRELCEAHKNKQTSPKSPVQPKPIPQSPPQTQPTPPQTTTSLPEPPKEDEKESDTNQQEYQRSNLGPFQKQDSRYLCENVTEGMHKLEEAGDTEEVLIVNCENSEYLISGRVKGITIDNCKRVKVQIHEVATAVEILNSSSINLLVKGAVPSISVSKSPDSHLVIHQEALDKEPKIITSMTDDLKIDVPVEDSEWKILSVPHRLETVIDPQTKTATTKVIEQA